MSLGKSFLLLGLDALTRSAARLRKVAKAKTFLILTLTAFLVVLCAPGAFAFQGNVSGIFTNPIEDPLLMWNQEMVATGVGTNTLVFGEAVGDNNPNSLQFEGQDFDITFNQPFTLGQVHYHNGTSTLYTSPVSVDLEITLGFNDPEELDQMFTYVLGIVITSNAVPTPEQRADYVTFPLDTQSTETYLLDGVEYTLEIIDLDPVSGGWFIDPVNPNRLYAYEEEDHEGGYDEDTVTATLVAMLYADVYRYEFTCQYNNGDSYNGYCYDNHSYEMNDEVLPFTDENGNEGYYRITADPVAIEDISLQGQVFVDSYFDAESGETYLAADGKIIGGTSTDYLGSESGCIIDASVADFFFGNQDGVMCEADLAVQYNFTHYYDDGCGDWYRGTVYAPEGFYGDTLPSITENGAGHYDISVAAYLEDVSQYGEVTVDTYFDGESGNTYLAADGKIIGGTGTENLGSESGHIIVADIPEYFFGAETPGGNIFEADLVSYVYAFTATYGNGDYYTGTVYAAPGYGYGEGYTETFTDENGKLGSYEITGLTSSNDGLAGQVFVDSYYDRESRYTYTPLHAGSAVGAEGLGSERDYLLLNGYVLNRFGIGPEGSEEVHYEADVTYPQDVYNRFSEPFRSIHLGNLHRCYLLLGTIFDDLFDDAV